MKIYNNALYKSLKLTRKLINISFLIIFVVLLFWGNYNPAAVFAMVFYNALHWLLLANYNQNAKSGKKVDNSYSELIELNVLKITLPIGILLHFLLGYGFMYKLPLKIERLKPLPLALIVIIILFRYISYLFIRIKLPKK